MAYTGLSIPIFAKYNNNNDGKVGYTERTSPGKAVTYSVKVTSSEDNSLYADNTEAETESGVFQNGELTLGTDDLTNETSLLILGLKEKTRTVDDKEYKELIYDDDAQSPYLGVGIIEQHIRNGVTTYRPIWFDKVKFNIPESTVNTRGQSIEWQTPTITGKIMRSDMVGDEGNHPWQHNGGECESESVALKYLDFWASYDPDKVTETMAAKATNAPKQKEAKA